MALKEPKIDAPLAEWEAWDTEIHRRLLQAYSTTPNYLLTRNKKTNAN